MQSSFFYAWFGASTTSDGDRSRLPMRMFWTALFVRVAYVTLARTYRVSAYEDHFQFGWEAARIARAVVTGHGYSDPFILGNTGPTAWLPPLFPLLIAGCFKLFGVYTPLAAWAVLSLNCLFSAATAPAVFEIADRCFNRRTAVWSGWIWALYPAAMQYAVKWVWEMSLTTMLFSWTLVIALRIRGIEGGRDRGGSLAGGSDPQTLKRWLIFGLLWALLANCNPSLLIFLPVCGIWMLVAATNLRKALFRAILSGLLFCALIAPWIGRNWYVFHTFIPLRGNFGAENWYGNGPDALGFPWGVIVAAKPDLEHLAQVGEVRYVGELGTKAAVYIREHPQHYIQLILKRFYFYWVSVPHPLGRSASLEYLREVHFCFLSLTGLLGLLLALHRRVPATGIFAAAFTLLPLTYYLVTAAARFRHPLEPLITILTVFLFRSVDSKTSQ